MTSEARPVAIVTGASRGIGAATARRLAERGFAVVVDYARDHASATAVVAAIRAEGGEAIAADISIIKEINKFFCQIDAKYV